MPVAGSWHEWPEGAPAADEEQRGQQRQHRDGGDRDAHRSDRPEPRGRVHSRQGEAEQRRDHRSRRGDDGRPALLQGDAHRGVPVLDPLELLPVASGEEERVVGARAEDEDQEDASGLPVDDHPRVGEERPKPSHDGLGEQDREERQDPEDRTAVDEDEQDEDEAGRHEQQRRVDPGERLRCVGGEARGARDLRLDPGWERVGRRGAHRVDRGDEKVRVAPGSDRHGHDGGGPVG